MCVDVSKGESNGWVKAVKALPGVLHSSKKAKEPHDPLMEVPQPKSKHTLASREMHYDERLLKIREDTAVYSNLRRR